MEKEPQTARAKLMDPVVEKIKPNILYLATLGGVMAALFLAGAITMTVMAGSSPSDMMIAAIAVLFTGAVGIGGATIALAGQVATNDPPNNVQAVIDYGRHIVDSLVPLIAPGRHLPHDYEAEPEIRRGPPRGE